MRGVVAAEERRIDDEAADHAGRTEADDRVVVAGCALAARLPAVHPLPAVGVLVLFPDRFRLPEKVLLLGEKVVGCVEHGAAEALGGEVDQLAEVSHVPIGVPICAPSSHTLRPRTYVARTTPCSSSPAYGVTLWRCWMIDSSTTNGASGSNARVSGGEAAGRSPFRRS